MKVFRQGDVMLVEVDQIPEFAQPAPVREDGKVVLAWGEVTGHHHRIETNNSAPSARLWDAGAERYLQVVKDGVHLRHEEHSAAVLPTGAFLVTIQTEYTPQALRRVAD